MFVCLFVCLFVFFFPEGRPTKLILRRIALIANNSSVKCRSPPVSLKIDDGMRNNAFAGSFQGDDHNDDSLYATEKLVSEDKFDEYE